MPRLPFSWFLALLCALAWSGLWSFSPTRGLRFPPPLKERDRVGGGLSLASPPAVNPSPRPPGSDTYTPTVAPASGEAALALKRIRVPAGTRADLFAAEPMLANPVCFCVDGRGRFYVAETFRLHAGVDDVRDHMDWLDDDLASRTVDDRVAMLRKHLGDQAANYEVEHERVRLLEDTTGTGHADRSTVFADGFHDLADGIGAGVLARGRRVWYACIPNLWLLEDTKGQGRADVRRVLHRGYGVHTSFYGHDLHGLRMGPDGRLYFSSGDRGLSVRTQGRVVACPDTGAVLRCDPDGSNLELFATGLRNPQELAFDEYGNLFTGDNNADHGDKARLVYVVEGGDSGWRQAYQYLESPTALGPWNAERLWETPWPDQAAYVLPPVAHVAAGPAGFTYYPGVASLPDRYRGHFFLCDFRGMAAASGVLSFAVKPRGASFEMVDRHECVWSVLATDVDFAPDGALYLTDWVDGWDKTSKGRIYRVHDPARDHDPAVLEVKRLLAEGMESRSAAELARFLGHADMRIRQEAQFALAARGREAIPVLAEVAHRGHGLARLHGIWGLGQVARRAPEALGPVLALTADSDAEVRAQAAKVLGEGPSPETVSPLASVRQRLVALLADPAPRPRFFAALALGRLGARAGADAVAALIAMLQENADGDPFLRHAGVMGLTGTADDDALRAAAASPSAAVRLAALLVLRRRASPLVARFLDDSQPRLVLEAARAVYDVPIPAVLRRLAALASRPGLSEPLGWRALNACFRLGRSEDAAAIAAVAARAEASEPLRIEALQELAQWGQPHGRDRVLGLWRPLPPRSPEPAARALARVLPGVLSGPDEVRQEAALVAGRLGIHEAGPMLRVLLADRARSGVVRVEVLKALQALRDPNLPEAVRLALADADPGLRMAGRRLQARVRPAEAVAGLADDLEHAAFRERQEAFDILGGIAGPEADALLVAWLDRLLAGRLAPEVQLDLIEAAGRRQAAPVREKLGRYASSKPRGDPLAGYRETLMGGDAGAGKKLFLGRTDLSCLRCHKLRGQGGDVGPDLTGIGGRQNRAYLLESIVDPNRQIAQGFDTVVITTTAGKSITGILKSEDAVQLRLMTPEGRLVTIPRNTIEERLRGKSAMPEDLVKHLSKFELRDLVEFLATLK